MTETFQEEIVAFEPGSALPGLDADAASDWLSRVVSDLSLPLDFGLIAAGGSNLTYKVTDAANQTWILRRPPAGAVMASAHDVGREYRIMQGLVSTDIPVPRPIVHCDDPTVLGAPFYVMSYEKGVILRDSATATAAGPLNCELASRSFFETLAHLHTHDLSGTGLEGLSRRDGYVKRQLRRWFQQYEEISGEDRNPLVEELHDRLLASDPGEIGLEAHLVHGDYHIDNAVLNPNFSVKAVLDWELATLGHPIADLAWALIFWAEPDDQMVMMQEGVTAAPGFLNREAVTRSMPTHQASLSIHCRISKPSGCGSCPASFREVYFARSPGAGVDYSRGEKSISAIR